MALSPVVIKETVDPDLMLQLMSQDEKFSRNLAAFQAEARELFRNHRGEVVVVAGGELRTFGTAESAWEWAHATHPEDEGVFVHYIPRERGWRVYAGRWSVVPVR